MPAWISRRITVLLTVARVISATATADDKGGHSRTPLKRVTFTFAPLMTYSQVFLAGTFNGWSPDAAPMEQRGHKFIVMMPLPAGEYQYKFVADGQWIADEKAERFHPDGYRGRNSIIIVDDSFEDVDALRDDSKITLDGIRHGSDAWERSLSEDGRLTLRVKAWMGDLEHVAICCSGGSAVTEGSHGLIDEKCDSAELFDTDGTLDYYQARADLPRFRYYFKLFDGAVEAVLDRNGPREAPVEHIDPFVFNASEVIAFKTPYWVKEAIIYQIFPESFANGSADNDPDFIEWYYEGLKGPPPSGKTNEEYFHMVEDRYDVAGLRVSHYKTDGKSDWNSFYGGDIEGVRQNLDYLEDLGITAIYFNQVFKAESNHKYDAAAYMKVDAHLATNDEFKAFVVECHRLGIRVVLDLGVNHTGRTHWAFLDAREKGEESPYWDWCEWKNWPVPGNRVWTPSNSLDYYDCWSGFGQMPNLNFDLSRPGKDEQTTTDIDDADPNWPLVNHVLDMAEFWLSDIDVDGYRLDVAAEIPFWFWELSRKRVKAVKPEAYMAREQRGSSSNLVNGRYFDAVMNYKFFRDHVLALVSKGDMSAPEFDRSLAQGRLVYPEEGAQVMMKPLDSHDTERFLTTAGNDIRRLKLAALFTMTYVGTTTVYYGDEIATTGGSGLDCRRPFYWKWPEESEQVEAHRYFRDLISLRKQHPCFVRGKFETLFAEDMVYAYRRTLPDDEAIVLLNARLNSALVNREVDESVQSLKAAIASVSIPVTAAPAGARFEIAVPALYGFILLPNRDSE